MAESVTTSIRLSRELRDELEQVARETHRGKSWIIKKALKEYFARKRRKASFRNPHKQSAVLSRTDRSNTSFIEFIRLSPLAGSGLKIKRNNASCRDVDL